MRHCLNDPAESRGGQARGMRVANVVVVCCSRVHYLRLQERIRAHPQRPGGQTSPGLRVKKKCSSSRKHEEEIDCQTTGGKMARSLKLFRYAQYTD